VIEFGFAVGLAALFAVVYVWAFRALPGERWQMLAAVPLAKGDAGWRGLNLTYYGFFTANAYVTGVAILLILMSSIGVPAVGTTALVVAVLAVCVPASRIVAQVVEKKKHTFTVGGALFVGVLIVPPAVWAVNATLGHWLGFVIPALPALAAISICYAIGEGIGRLACISFGCCYGKPLCDCHGVLQKAFARFSFTFSGSTKKALYEGKFEGQRLVPVQAITAILYTSVGVVSVYLFLTGSYACVLLLAMGVTQVWRVISEFLRADFRGKAGKLTVYQVMALLTVVYCGLLVLLLGGRERIAADALAGLKSLWNPFAILLLQALWLAIFLYTGRSEVTESTLQFAVRHDRV